jgi:DnaK suppressor protein
VQNALERIEKGTYGKCIVCGQPIPEKRLEALPWAARCVKDEERLEERNLSITETYDADLN